MARGHWMLPRLLHFTSLAAAVDGKVRIVDVVGGQPLRGSLHDWRPVVDGPAEASRDVVLVVAVLERRR